MSGKSVPSAGNKLRRWSQAVTQKRQNIKIYQPMANGRRQTQQRQESSHHSAKQQRGLDLENGACPLGMLNSLPRNHTRIPTLISSSSDWKSRVGPCLPFPAGSCPPERGLVITFLSEASGGLHKIVLKGPGTQWVLNKRQASVPVLEITLYLLAGALL